jgi:hypothetical protein
MRWFRAHPLLSLVLLGVFIGLASVGTVFVAVSPILFAEVQSLERVAVPAGESSIYVRGAGEANALRVEPIAGSIDGTPSMNERLTIMGKTYEEVAVVSSQGDVFVKVLPPDDVIVDPEAGAVVLSGVLWQLLLAIGLGIAFGAVFICVVVAIMLVIVRKLVTLASQNPTPA